MNTAGKAFISWKSSTVELLHSENTSQTSLRQGCQIWTIVITYLMHWNRSKADPPMYCINYMRYFERIVNVAKEFSLYGMCRAVTPLHIVSLWSRHIFLRPNSWNRDFVSSGISDQSTTVLMLIFILLTWWFCLSNICLLLQIFRTDKNKYT